MSYICFLSTQYQAVAEMQSTDFPTPLSQAECVSLVMTYELYRTTPESENKTVTLLDWIVRQLDSEERNPASQFAVSSN